MLGRPPEIKEKKKRADKKLIMRGLKSTSCTCTMLHTPSLKNVVQFCFIKKLRMLGPIILLQNKDTEECYSFTAHMTVPQYSQLMTSEIQVKRMEFSMEIHPTLHGLKTRGKFRKNRTWNTPSSPSDHAPSELKRNDPES